MNLPRGMFLALVAPLVIFGGLGLGAVLALVAHTHTTQQTTTVAVAQPTAKTALVPPTTAPRATTSRVVYTVAPTPTSTTTAVPTPTPTAKSTVSATARPTTIASVTGTWRMDEANTQVGTIVWIGSAIAHGSELIFDLHKAAVGGRSAVPCERDTNLHIVLNAASAPQTVPYHEVNCAGAASSGVVRVSVVPTSGSFSGSFWDGGTKLGDFNATQQR